MTLKCQMNSNSDNRNCISHTKRPFEEITELEERPKFIVPVKDKREIKLHSPTVNVAALRKSSKEDSTDLVNWQGCRYD